MAYEGDETKLAYDLRQTNAKIISIHWLSVVQSRHSVVEWFRALRYFYTILKHDVKGGRLKDYEKDYNDLKKEIMKLAIENPQIFIGSQRNPKIEWQIEEALLKLEERLTDEITKSNMRGSYFEDDGGL